MVKYEGRIDNSYLFTWHEHWPPSPAATEPYLAFLNIIKFMSKTTCH